MGGQRTPDASTRKWLAVGIVGLSIVGIVVLAVVAILEAGSSRAETSRLVFSSILPLLGTWVGTVLAFYFARENLQAATQSALSLAGAADTGTPVTQVMIPEVDFIAYDLQTNEPPETVSLATIHGAMSQISPPSRRLPIRSTTGAILYIVHDSTLSAYAESQAQSSAALDRTLGDLLAVPEYRQLISAIGFVPEKATVAEARTVMTSVEYCNDVVVTPTGKRDERATGWLTNTLLAGIQ